MVRSWPAGIAGMSEQTIVTVANIAGYKCDLVRTVCRVSDFIFSAHEQSVLRKIPCGLSPSVPQERGHEPLELL
jgi:hypothetical protein